MFACYVYLGGFGLPIFAMVNVTFESNARIQFCFNGVTEIHKRRRRIIATLPRLRESLNYPVHREEVSLFSEGKRLGLVESD